MIWDSRPIQARTETYESLVPVNIPLDSILIENLMKDRKSFDLIRCESLFEIESFIHSRDSYPGPHKCMLSPHTSTEYSEHKARLYLTPDLRGGVAVIGEELASLFSYPGAHYGGLLIESAKILGARYLSCFDCDGALPRFYSRHGFQEIKRHKWNPQYAPAQWNYELFGTPDVVEMSL